MQDAPACRNWLRPRPRCVEMCLRTLQRVHLRIVVRGLVRQQRPELRAGDVAHAAVVLGYVLQWHPETDLFAMEQRIVAMCLVLVPGRGNRPSRRLENAVVEVEHGIGAEQLAGDGLHTLEIDAVQQGRRIQARFEDLRLQRRVLVAIRAQHVELIAFLAAGMTREQLCQYAADPVLLGRLAQRRHHQIAVLAEAPDLCGGEREVTELLHARSGASAICPQRNSRRAQRSQGHRGHRRCSPWPADGQHTRAQHPPRPRRLVAGGRSGNVRCESGVVGPPAHSSVLRQAAAVAVARDSRRSDSSLTTA
jgi:hypothetical protein